MGGGEQVNDDQVKLIKLMPRGETAVKNHSRHTRRAIDQRINLLKQKARLKNK